MKSLIVLALSFATAVPAMACTIQTSSGAYAGNVNGGMVTNSSGRPVGSVQGDVVYDYVGSPAGRVNTTSVQNLYGQNIGFVQGNAIFNLYGEQRGQGLNCTQEEKGAALLLVLGIH